MRFPRAGGILVHPTSFPGPYGMGDLGQAAYRFVDFLAEAGIALWQVLPLGPTGYGDSPYASFSAFAGNALLISPALLLDDGWLDAEDLAAVPSFPEERVDYGPVIEWKRSLLLRAYERFKTRATDADRDAFWSYSATNASWLDDFARFMAIKEAHGGVAWNEWEPTIARHESHAVWEWEQRLKDEVNAQRFLQWQFARQWSRLKTYANDRNIRVIGDVPIFVAFDSADVWARPDLFYLDEERRPTVVSGVPPDYFSETGQLWGNPIYRWDRMRASGYEWWVERFRQTFSQLDLARIDHFRGFEAYWEVPYGEPTAVHGRWVLGPGLELFEAVRQRLGSLAIIAEDLGVITPEVEALREALGFPGMRILQFAFSTDADDPFLPHNYPHNTVVYTGSHDNDTTLGWYVTASEEEKRNARRYLDLSDDSQFVWALIRLAFASVADQALVPLQDVLNLGTEARMNYPGRPAGNWTWRYQAEALRPQLAAQLRELVTVYGREPDPFGAPKVPKRHP